MKVVVNMSRKGKTEKDGIGGATAPSPSAPQTFEAIFEQNLSNFIKFARERGATVKPSGRLVYKGVTLSSNIRQDLQDYIDESAPYDELIHPKWFWQHLIFQANCSAFIIYLEKHGAYWDYGWYYSGVELFDSVREYLSPLNFAYERLLTKKEMQVLFQNLLEYYEWIKAIQSRGEVSEDE